MKKTKRRSFLGWMFVGLLTSSAIAGCSSAQSESETNQSEVKLTLVSYAVTQSAYEQIIPQFAQEWKAKTGQDVVIEQSYGGSGSQTRAVIDGLEADVVALALALDTKKIEEAGLIEPGWEQELPNDSIVHKSVVALVKRDDNVKVSQWSDLAKDGIQPITANPKTSGGARWNFLALWGAVSQAGGSEQEAELFTEKVLKNVPILPKDARESSEVFYQQGQGNILINYENEVVLAQQKGESLPYVIPTDYNISIDSPVAVVDANVDKHGTREVAQAFAEFLFTPEAQREFAKVGFRPVDQTVAKEFTNQYPEIKNLFTVQNLGGWDKIQTKFFDDGAVFDKLMNKVN
ncbi:sulfate ABC transporter, periplasmic sulfate-binding protein [Stanieria cyanosphaera PCC 7437]|uniref:Sulfate-binding protein n=1 Tax=Stanieria cyanosphaera (strain ATCC 29371 / PCC 7437) TaxID=111780 RepID=K9XW64_STAC7|nr:sulfate ABC transporter substrate-binding protein [Stanieria cyanosphaera]AFZ36778.1 sulfate ABC transporter, periplasmic sulfate-binding protein [Stanieria cyanosphaera PCC 7437]